MWWGSDAQSPPPPRTSADWLNEILGRRYPIVATFSNKSFTDGDLEKIVLPLRSLQHLSMRDVAVTDDGLLRLDSLRALRHLRCIRDPDPRSQKVIEELDKHTILDLNQTPLDDVLDYLSDLHGIPFVMDQRECAAAGIDGNLPITQNVKGNGLSLGEALDATLNPHGLGWVIKDASVIAQDIKRFGLEPHTSVMVTSAKVAKQDRRRILVKKLRAMLPDLKEIEVD